MDGNPGFGLWMETQTKGAFFSWVDSDVIHAIYRQQRVAKGSERQEGLLITIRPTSGGNALRLQAVSVAQSDRSPVGTLSCDSRSRLCFCRYLNYMLPTHKHGRSLCVDVKNHTSQFLQCCSINNLVAAVVSLQR